MGILDKVKNGMETAQNLSRKVGEVRDTFSTRATKIENSDAEEAYFNTRRKYWTILSGNKRFACIYW